MHVLTFSVYVKSYYLIKSSSLFSQQNSQVLPRIQYSDVCSCYDAI